jgi:hypothetical protein
MPERNATLCHAAASCWLLGRAPSQATAARVSTSRASSLPDAALATAAGVQQCTLHKRDRPRHHGLLVTDLHCKGLVRVARRESQQVSAAATAYMARRAFQTAADRPGCSRVQVMVDIDGCMSSEQARCTAELTSRGTSAAHAAGSQQLSELYMHPTAKQSMVFTPENHNHSNTMPFDRPLRTQVHPVPPRAPPVEEVAMEGADLEPPAAAYAHHCLPGGRARQVAAQLC